MNNLKQLNDIIDSVQSDLKTLNQVLNVQNGQSLNARNSFINPKTDAIHKTADGWTIEKDAIFTKIERVAIKSN